MKINAFSQQGSIQNNIKNKKLQLKMIKVENLRIENISPDKILFLSVFKGSGTAEYNTIYAL